MKSMKTFLFGGQFFFSEALKQKLFPTFCKGWLPTTKRPPTIIDARYRSQELATWRWFDHGQASHPSLDFPIHPASRKMAGVDSKKPFLQYRMVCRQTSANLSSVSVAFFQ
jgi:hypothetical protein